MKQDETLIAELTPHLPKERVGVIYQRISQSISNQSPAPMKKMVLVPSISLAAFCACLILVAVIVVPRYQNAQGTYTTVAAGSFGSLTAAATLDSRGGAPLALGAEAAAAKVGGTAEIAADSSGLVVSEGFSADATSMIAPFGGVRYRVPSFSLEKSLAVAKRRSLEVKANSLTESLGGSKRLIPTSSSFTAEGYTVTIDSTTASFVLSKDYSNEASRTGTVTVSADATGLPIKTEVTAGKKRSDSELLEKAVSFLGEWGISRKGFADPVVVPDLYATDSEVPYYYQVVFAEKINGIPVVSGDGTPIGISLTILSETGEVESLQGSFATGFDLSAYDLASVEDITKLASQQQYVQQEAAEKLESPVVVYTETYIGSTRVYTPALRFSIAGKKQYVVVPVTKDQVDAQLQYATPEITPLGVTPMIEPATTLR